MEIGKIKIVRIYNYDWYSSRVVLDTGEEIDISGEYASTIDEVPTFSTTKKGIAFVRDKFKGDIEKMMYINERGYRDIKPEVRDELARVIIEYCIHELKEDDYRIVFEDIPNDVGYPEPGYYNGHQGAEAEKYLLENWKNLNTSTKERLWDKGLRPAGYKEGEPREKYIAEIDMDEVGKKLLERLRNMEEGELEEHIAMHEREACRKYKKRQALLCEGRYLEENPDDISDVSGYSSVRISRSNSVSVNSSRGLSRSGSNDRGQEPEQKGISM